MDTCTCKYECGNKNPHRQARPGPLCSWKELGHDLGLDKATLDDIEKEYRSIPEECFKKCMHTWLRGGGTGKQVKTWRTFPSYAECTTGHLVRKCGMKPLLNALRISTLSLYALT